MPTIKYLHSDMPGAPVLSGTAGALTTLLDTLLTTGFGLKSVTGLVVLNGVATATVASGHGLVPYATVLIAGATPAGLNGEHVVSAIGANTVSWATTEANGTATGTITLKVAPLGWTKAFTGTNLAAYKASSPEATGGVLRIDDTGTLNARVLAYETMTDIATGTGPCPTAAQVAGGLYWPKSSTASAVARPWVLLGDERAFYLCVAPGAGQPGNFTVLFAGDYGSWKSGDAYGFALAGNQSDQSNFAGTPDGCMGYSNRNASTGLYTLRAFTSLGAAQAVTRVGATHIGTTPSIYAGMPGYAFGAYPNNANNELVLCKVLLYTGLGFRGELPGLWHPIQDMASAFNTHDQVDGTGVMVGRRLLAVRPGSPAAASFGAVFVDLTGPWR